MISDSEALTIYNELRGVLAETGFSWVLDEVDGEVRLGKTEAKRIRISERDAPSDFLLRTETRYGKPTTFTGSVEYTAHERLGLLIDALEHASVDVAELHEAAVHILTQASSAGHAERSITEILFIDPITGESRESSTPETRQRLSAASARLRPLLQELRREL
jgi:hypothetical protein